MLSVFETYVLEITISIVYTILYVFLISKIFPKYIFKPTIKSGLLTDRGIKKFTSKNNKGILYQTFPSYKKYIDKYFLYEKDGCKYLKCNVLSGVKNIVYEIYMFNSKNKLIDVLEINEVISNNKTNAIMLSENTSYVQLIVRKANDIIVEENRFLYFPINKVVIFTLLNVVSTFFALVFLNHLAVDFYYVLTYGLFDSPIYFVGILNTSIILYASIIIGFVLTLLTVLSHKKNKIKVGNL